MYWHKGAKCTVRKACCWMIEKFGSRRIGEASNLGPNKEKAGILEYPVALKLGFRCIRTPGFDEKPWTGEVERRREDFSLVTEIVNTTGWKALKRTLMEICADLVLAQEHWRRGVKVAEASRWARAKGWKPVWAEVDGAMDEKGA